MVSKPISPSIPTFGKSLHKGGDGLFVCDMVSCVAPLCSRGHNSVPPFFKGGRGGFH